jgi:hypothetical protein
MRARHWQIQARWVVTGVVVAIVVGTGAQATPVQRAVVLGFVYADLITWAMSLVLALPRLELADLVEAAAQVVAVASLLLVYGLERPADGEATAVGFLVFFVCLSLKLLWRALASIAGDLEDG